MSGVAALRHALASGLIALAAGWLASPAAHAADTSAACPPEAQPLTPEQVQTGRRDARDRGFLWRISQGGRQSYLYGTIHVAEWRWMFPGPGVSRALAESDTIALELDLLDADIASRLRSGMAARRGVALPDALQVRLRQQMQAACVTPEALASMGPELQVATLSMLVGRAAGLDAAYGIDNVLAGMARSAAKRVVSLETPELQLQVLQATDEASTAELVASGLADLESGRAGPLLERLARAWAESDDAELAHYEDWCECIKTALDRDLMKRLLDDRNPGLAAAIDALHRGGSRVFAAVGSLHMVGPQGLPALLAQRGYAVERINMPR